LTCGSDFPVRRSLVLGSLAKLTAKDIQSVDDLYKIPPSTKMEMVADVAADQPWGTYLASEEVIRGMDALGDEFAFAINAAISEQSLSGFYGISVAIRCHRSG
jgi:hypothetical protein